MKIIDIITRAAASHSARFTFELLPPLKGEGTGLVFEAIDTLAPLDPAYINVTFHREDASTGVRHRPGTVGISAAIARRYGIETVPHIICGGMSRYDIEDALIDMDFLGLHNVLALRGDGDFALRPGDSAANSSNCALDPGSHSHADSLVAQIVAMNHGQLVDPPPASRASAAPPHRTDFCIGVAGYPEGHSESPDLQTDIAFLKRKVDAGADYIVTQMCFDNRLILDFAERCRAADINVPIVPGIKPLATLGHLEILPKTFHVCLPEELSREVLKCRNTASIRQAGIEWAAHQAAGLKRAGFPVIHFYSMGRTDNIAQIVKRIF